MSAACRQFLADLPDSLLVSGVPEHARQCTSCAARLQAGRRLAGWLRQRPAVPDVVRGRAAFERVFERVVEQAEQAPLGQMLEGALTRQPMPADESVATNDLARRLFATEVPAPTQLWPRVREEVAHQISGRRRLSSPQRIFLAVAAAAVVVSSLVVLEREGTQVQVAIVFEDMTAAPDTAIMPVSVLRSNLR